jgi:hypothetical protein
VWFRCANREAPDIPGQLVAASQVNCFALDRAHERATETERAARDVVSDKSNRPALTSDSPGSRLAHLMPVGQSGCHSQPPSFLDRAMSPPAATWLLRDMYQIKESCTPILACTLADDSPYLGHPRCQWWQKTPPPTFPWLTSGVRSCHVAVVSAARCSRVERSSPLLSGATTNLEDDR